MVSSTQQNERIRKRKLTTAGKRNKRTLRRLGTPAFAVHPEGYDIAAADAKPAKVERTFSTKKPKVAKKAAVKPAKKA
jgi:hypothetical protein